MRLIGLAVVLAVGLILVPVVGEAQQTQKIGRVGRLMSGSPGIGQVNDAFTQGLRDLCYVEGRNVLIEYRYADGKPERFAALAAELVALKVDVIVVPNTRTALAAKQSTSTLPIVFFSVSDPVGSGLVASLARPGGNVTGLSNVSPELVGKALELLKEVVPTVRRVGVLWEPGAIGERPARHALAEAEVAGRALGMQLQLFQVGGLGEFDRAFADLTRAGVGALTVLSSPMFFAERNRLAGLASKNRLPSVFTAREHVEAGSLMSYGPNFADSVRRAATYVDKILKGAKPADLPVEQPTKFELVINLKTAKALSLTIPQSLLLRADQVIE
jgi:putative tryptophan/tyrosine transport system substrate-binding protein